MNFHGHLVTQEISISWNEQGPIVLSTAEHSGPRAVRHSIELRDVVIPVARGVGVAIVLRTVNATIRRNVHHPVRGVVIHKQDLVDVCVDSKRESRRVVSHSGLFGLLVGA